MGAVGFQVVDFGEDAAQAADVNRLRLEFAFAHHHGQQGEDFLGAPQGEGGNQDRAAAVEHALDGLAEALDFRLAREAGRERTVAARGFHDQHVGLHVLEPGAPQDGLVMEANVAGVEEGFLPAADHDAGGAERVAGVVELQRGREEAGAGLVKGGPIDLAVVFEALEAGGQVVHLVVAVEGILFEAQFVALALHDVDGVVQHAFDEEVAQLGHQDMGLGKVAQGDRQRPDMIVMAMGDGDGVHLLVLDQVIERQARPGPRAGDACRRPSAAGVPPFPRTRRWRRCPCPGSG